jgi:hypothetical protein
MQSSTLITTEFNDAQTFTRNLGVFKRIRRAGSLITNDTFEDRVITVSGEFEQTSLTNLEAAIDDFENAMAIKYGVLDIDYEGGTRRYIATPQRVNAPRPHRGSTWADFSVDFLITEYGKDTASTTLVNNVNKTASPATQAMTVDGSAPQQYTIITVTLNSFTGASLNTITLGNNQTTQAVSISRQWTAADVLVIDVENQTCKVNGVIVDFSGAFPQFKPGSRTLSYIDDMTARSVNITVTYVKRWL